ncbi:MAG TPA: outer membrane protein transport protein [Phycisphaerae bacterium]|nr:outer membrane protein transport protein [Phycisphaerae bacterium]HPZ98836.1 outer membrane protein transport protein [Phycisphaerae bacterium]
MHVRTLHVRFRWTIPVLLLAARVALATDGIEPIGVSVQSRMRGGADVAVGDSTLSQIDNPATLSLSPRGLYSLDESSKLAFIDLPWRGPYETVHSKTKLIHLHNLGLAMPVDDRLTFGLALHSKAGVGTSFNQRHLLIPWMERRVGSDMKVMGFNLSAAYKLTEKLSLGVGGRVEVATSRFSKVLGPADIDFGRGYAYGGGFQLGLHYQARKDLAFGLGYRSPTWFGDLEGGRAKASLLGILPVPLGDAKISDLRLPQRVTMGAAWDATDWLKLIGEVRWLNYADGTFNRMTIVTDGLVDVRYPMPLGYRDIWAFILGAEFKLAEHWILGTGYQYLTTPVDRANLSPMCSIPVQHHFTVGLRYETPRWMVGAGYILAFRQSLKGPGYSRIPLGFDYGLSEVAQTQHMISVGFGYRW